MAVQRTKPNESATTDRLPSPVTYDAFISYASADKEKAFEICESLESGGSRCWIAPRDVRAGREYANEIVLGIEHSRCFVLVLSEAANQSEFVRREVERAVSKRKPVFPIRIEEVLPSPALELFVSATHWIDAWSGALVKHVERLAQDLANVADSEYVQRRPPQSPWNRALKFAQSNIQSLVALSAIAVLAIAMLVIRSSIAPRRYEGTPAKKLDEITRKDLQLSSRSTDVGDRLIWTLQLHADWTVLAAIEKTRLYYSIDGGTFKLADSPVAFNVDSRKNFKEISLKFSDSDGKTVGPFQFNVDTASEVSSIAHEHAGTLSDWIKCGPSYPPFLSCVTTPPADVRSAAKEIRYGFSAKELQFVYDLAPVESASVLSGPSPLTANSFLVPHVSDSIFVQLTFKDGSKSGDPQEILARSPYIGETLSQESPRAFPIASTDRGAYSVYATVSDRELNSWLVTPFPNDSDVLDISWSPDKGGMFPVKHELGFFSFAVDAKTLGLTLPTATEPASPKTITIRYGTGSGAKTYTYAADFWAITTNYLKENLHFPDAIDCRYSQRGEQLVVFPVVCDIPSGDVIRALLIDKIWWGIQPDQLQDVDRFSAHDLVDRWLKDQTQAGTPARGQKSFSTAMAQTAQTNRLNEEAFIAERQMTNSVNTLRLPGGVYVPVHNIVVGMSNTSSVYFKIKYRNQTENELIRIQVK
jgi:TIR domain